MDPKLRSRDAEIARLATRQHGVVTAAQLLAAGLTRQAIKRRVAGGRLHRVHRGVFRVGHRAPSTDAAYLAAVLACGSRAVLSGLAAAHHLRIWKRRKPPPEVTSTDDRCVSGVRTRRVRELHPQDTCTHRAIPTTTVPRTIVDLAARLSLDSLARVCHEAEVLHGTGPAAVAAVVRRRGWTPGVGKLRAIYDGDHPVTLSRLESDFLAVLAAAHLPIPQTNRPAGAHRVDCRWPEHRLTVELDGFRFHHSRHAWNQDRRREREARARGDEFRRYTWDDVHDDSAPMLAELRALLHRR